MAPEGHALARLIKSPGATEQDLLERSLAALRFHFLRECFPVCQHRVLARTVRHLCHHTYEHPPDRDMSDSDD